MCDEVTQSEFSWMDLGQALGTCFQMILKVRFLKVRLWKAELLIHQIIVLRQIENLNFQLYVYHDP